MSRVGRHALEAGDDRDLALGQRLADALAAHLDDLRLAVLGVGDDAGLAAGEAHRGLAEILDGHRQQRHRDALARGEQHVHLAAAGVAGDVVGEADEVVGGLAHGRDHGHDVVARPARPDEVIGDGPDAIRVGDRRPAELLNQETHGRQGYRRPRANHGRVSPPCTFSGRAESQTNASARRKTPGLAREAREAELKKRRRNRTIRNAAIAACVFVVAIVIINLVERRQEQQEGRRQPDDRRHDDHDDQVDRTRPAASRPCPRADRSRRTSRRRR